MLRFYFSLPFLLLFIASAALNTFGQADKDFPPELPEDTYGRPRSRGDITGGSEVFRFRKPVYRLKRKVPKPARLAKKESVKSSSSARFKLPVDKDSAEKWETIGLTVWRVQRNSKAAESGPEANLIDQRTGERYKPVRANADTVFRLGEEVRFSVESPREGYLYIVNREILGDDKMGSPWQVFPTMLSRGGNNFVRPGQLIDIPGQADPPFILKSTTPGYRGEMITIILSPIELVDFTVPSGLTRISEELVDELEKRYLADVGEYEQQGSVGAAYTSAEKEAGNARQLTQADPLPQTRYRVRMRPKEPMVINVGLTAQ